MRGKRCVVGAMAVVVALGGGACSKAKSAAKSTKLDAYDFRFEPTALSVKAGSKVVVVVHNEGKALHNFSVSQANVDTDVQADKRTTVTFTAPSSPGTVEFICKYHAGQGMKGTLNVT